MRGISSGGDGVHSGSMPSVGVYLDEQPVTTINRVLDVHVYDIERIETLAGPQGTYFGASSQAGTMRIITNKPKMNEFEAGFDVGGNTVSEGGTGYTLEGFVNMPVSDNAAMRVVGWYDESPGYIDNVLSSVTFQGVGITKDNAALVEGRLQRFDEDRHARPAQDRPERQLDCNARSDDAEPGYQRRYFARSGRPRRSAGRRFYDEYYDYSWYQASLTVEGRIGDMDLVYAGAYLDLDSDSVDDYTHYAQYLDNFYGYSYGGCYHYDSNGFCTNPSQYIMSDEKFAKQSHELRLQSSEDQAIRWMVGAFMQRQEHNFDLRWEVPDLDTASSVIENGNVVWQTKQDRVDKDLAVFGEVSFDVNDNLTLVAGYRWYEFENSLFGFNGDLGRCLDANDVPQYPCYDLHRTSTTFRKATATRSSSVSITTSATTRWCMRPTPRVSGRAA